jgi:CBS domain-containing protein
LAEKRLKAGQAKRDEVIRRNMTELIDLLVSDPDMLPCEAAETIAVARIASSERDRTVSDVMAPIVALMETQSVREAADILVREKGDILAIVSPAGDLTGVVTAWNITQASAVGISEEAPVTEIMTREVISACPTDSILEVVRKLEHYEISAMPVVTEAGVTGLISSDILAQRTLYRLLQTQKA